MAGKREEQLKEITERLEQGVKDLFTSEKYMDYLKTMSQFHNYSFNNTLLIAMQKPDATLVAGYQAWQKKFNRHVKKGEKGIQIISPAPIRQKEEVEKLDPDTREPVLKDNGQPETEEVEYVIPRFKVASVFDVTQTDGEPLPSLGADELTASVENYEIFMQAITAVSPVPIRFDEIEGESHGYYHNVDKEIVIKQGMSESQTMKTAIHEVAHAKLHDRELMAEQGIQKDQMTREVEAESIAYTVCQHFGLDTSDYSFPYIAGWSSNVDMKELRTSMDTIRHTAGEFIEELSAQLQELQMDTPEKQHLRDEDLVLKISASMESDYTYDVIRGMKREQLLEAVTDFKRLEENDEFIGEPDLETYLSERGAEVIPWYTSNGYEVEYPINFYDIEYDADTGITDAASLSSMTQAELLINRAEYGSTLFNNDDRNLIVNYAYQFDNMEDTKTLIHELAEAIQAPDLRAPSEVIQNAQAEIDALPDSMIGMTRMHEYGYENSGMLPLTKERALELYHQNLEIFCLYEDGTEATYDNEAALHTHDGIYGIEKETWERYRAQEKVEQRIMEGQEEMFSIYQVRDDGSGRDYKFMGTSFLEKNGMQAFWEDYNLMYTDVLTENDTLDYIFQRFNIDRPDDFAGHSMSVSDVIVVSHNGEAKSYYVDSFGFTELPGFFKQREQEREVYLPVFRGTLAEAMEHGMADAYLDSRKLNMDCKHAIEEAIRENFDGLHLNHGVVTPVLEEYGAERVAFVLADTLQHLSEDGRFSRDNKAWANRIHIPENRRDELDLNADYIVTSHPAVLDGFVNIFREEARERLEELDVVLTGVPEAEPTELAYEVGGGFLSIHETDGGYDYTFYGKDYLEIDGGVYDNPEVTIYKALEAVLEDEGYSIEDCTPMDYEELDAAVELEEEARFKRLQAEMQEKNTPETVKETLTSDSMQPEAALNGQSRAEIEELVLDYAQSELDAMGLEEDVKLIGARVYGSRTREGLYKGGSDIDVVLSYEGDIAEDTFFNILHQHGMKVADMDLDVNPISVEKTGSLEDYLKQAEKYLDEKESIRKEETLNEPVGRVTFANGEEFVYTDPKKYLEVIDQEIEYSNVTGFQYITLSDDPELRKAVEDRYCNLIGENNPHDLSYYQNTKKQMMPEKEASISFYVAECMEFPVLGQYEENLTMEEALKIYEQIPAQRMNGIKGVGFHLEDGSIYDGDYELMSADRMDVDLINCIEHYKESPLVQDSIQKMQAYLDAKEIEKTPVVTDVEKAEKNESVKSEQFEEPAGKTIEAVSKPEPVQTQIKQPDPEKTNGVKKEGKKESVLKALRDRQAKLKSQEQNKSSKEKSQQNKKGDVEL